MVVGYSFIVPFHSGLGTLARCLAALTPLPPGCELIVAADGAQEDCGPLVTRHGGSLVVVDGPSGPAVARNAAAAVALGDVLVFVDADVVVSRAGLQNLIALFQTDASTDAAFGAYDDSPDDPGFISQYKNLSHAYEHRASVRRARTFWAGFGAVRRSAFEAVGGFDERFRRPSVEDIDLGYRLTDRGYTVVVDPALAACHLKRWTLVAALTSDLRDRGIPWTQLMLRYGVRGDHLNVSPTHQWSVVLAYLALGSLLLTIFEPGFAVGLALGLPAFLLINRAYYLFLYRSRGLWFAAKAWPIHLLHHWCNGFSFVAGATLFLGRRYLQFDSPHTLSTDSWNAARADISGRETVTVAQGVSQAPR